MQNAVQLAKERFDKRTQELESAILRLKDELSTAQSDASASLSADRKRNEEEIQNLVRKANDKYNNMLVEQLRLQDELRAEMERRATEVQKAVADAKDVELEQRIGQLRAELSGDKQEVLMKLRREYDEKLQVRDTYVVVAR
jgi:hypothetical protein